jgi:hypothetical protein
LGGTVNVLRRSNGEYRDALNDAPDLSGDNAGDNIWGSIGTTDG